MHKLAMTGWGALLFVLGCFGALQAQPPAATEEPENELINLDRPVDAKTDVFRILRTSNKFETNNYVTKVYRLRNANPYELLPYVRKMVEAEKGLVATAFNPDEKGVMRAWIQVTVPQFLVSYLDSAIPQLDVPDFKSSPGDVRISYRTQHRCAQEIAEFIRNSDLSPDGKIVADPVTNTVFLYDSPSDFKRVISTLQFYDIPAPEIDLEAWVVELTKIDQTKLGLDWDAWKTSLGGRLNFSDTYARINDAAGQTIKTDSQGFDGLLSLDATTLASFLNYLVDNGKAETVIDTHLRVVNHEIGTLDTLTEVPEYIYADDKDKKTLTEVPDTAVNEKYEGLSIKVQPVVAMNSTRLKFDLNLRTPIGIGKTGNPIYAERAMNTDLEVASGDLYRVARLTRNVIVNENKGLPGLRLIPGIKYLFGSEEKLMRDIDVYIFARPTWVTPKMNAVVAMSGTETLKEFPYTVENILKANPNIQISEEDQKILNQYFGAKYSSYKGAERSGETSPKLQSPALSDRNLQK